MRPPRKKTENAAASSVIDWPEVNRVLDFMAQHGLDEFEYSQGDVRIHLRKPGSTGGAVIPFVAPSAPSVVPQPAALQGPPPSPASATSTLPAAEAAPAPAAVAADLHVIKSPIVGTFYSAANPQSPPFVKPGDQIAPGKVLCIVEAMKLMNEIEAEVAGEVVLVLVKNGDPVEYGQPLFHIRPAQST